METILQGLSSVCVYFDDKLITGKTNEEHLVNLSAVLHRFTIAGMKLKPDKCSFLLQVLENGMLAILLSSIKIEVSILLRDFTSSLLALRHLWPTLPIFSPLVYHFLNQLDESQDFG